MLILMVWDMIGQNMRSHILCIQGNLYSNRYFGRFSSLRYYPSFRKLHILYFTTTISVHMWWGLCKPSSKNDRITASLCLHVCQTCHPLNIPGIWLVSNLFVMVFQQSLLTLYGLTYKLHGGIFPRKIFRPFLPCQEVYRLWFLCMEASYHADISWS